MAKVLLSDASDSSDSEVGGTQVTADLKVNEEFAKRFEYNKKREELQKLEEKHGRKSDPRSRKRKRDGGDDDLQSGSGSDSSTSEDEDEDGEFATAALDDEIMATLKAIKSKDPRVYDENVKFYGDFDENAPPTQSGKKEKEKPVYLRDYHRENLRNGRTNGEERDEDEPMTYNQQQDKLKRDVVKDFHTAVDGSESEDEDDGGLLVKKTKTKAEQPARPVAKLDIENADRDPEVFLSNFMAARAWVPNDQSEFQPFESDDEEDEKRAEEFEEAYNLRFEDPEKSNEKLQSYARDMAAKYSVRRDEQNSRKKKRDAEKAAKEAAKQELKEEKARLKKLKMEQVQEKVKRIKRAAGLKTEDIQPEDWAHFINEDWDDSRWEEEMQKRFNDQYYAEKEDLSADDSAHDSGTDADPASKKKRKPKKPKFDDDIDITDIIPDFETEEPANFSLTDDEDESKQPKKKSKKQDRIERQKDCKKERRIIEQLVEDQLQMDLDHALPASSRAKAAGFRYRETSPQTFGLTHRDILLADDTALNQFAGLKKLASWRDEEKKRKDRKHLGKKARLRKWRMDTFGDEEGLEQKDLAYAGVKSTNGGGDAAQGDASDDEFGGVDIREGGKKKKGRRRKKAKTADSEAVTA